MKVAPFEYVAPTNPAEAAEALSREGAKILAGGQSLTPLMALRLAEPALLVDINRSEGLSGITVEETGGLRIGATTRQSELEDWSRLLDLQPLIAEAIPLIGHRAIRNRGTVGGSLAHADPAAEWPCLAVVLEAQIEATSVRGTRWLPALDFFQGPLTTVLEDDEFITSVRIPPFPHAGWGIYEVSRRHGDFPLIGALAILRVENAAVSFVRIGIMNLLGTPFRATALENALLEAEFPDLQGTVNEQLPTPDDLISDAHTSASFRAHLARVAVCRALDTAWKNAEGKAVNADGNY